MVGYQGYHGLYTLICGFFSFLIEQETGETEIEYRNHRWENTGNHNRGRKFQNKTH